MLCPGVVRCSSRVSSTLKSCCPLGGRSRTAHPVRGICRSSYSGPQPLSSRSLSIRFASYRYKSSYSSLLLRSVKRSDSPTRAVPGESSCQGESPRLCYLTVHRSMLLVGLTDFRLKLLCLAEGDCLQEEDGTVIVRDDLDALLQVHVTPAAAYICSWQTAVTYSTWCRCCLSICAGL